MEFPTTFSGGDRGVWRIVRLEAVLGAELPAAGRIAVEAGESPRGEEVAWSLRGVPSYERYVRRDEQRELKARSPLLGRPEASLAALIPIRKSDAWWEMPQDERRAIFEERSHHTAIGLRHLPAVARRLYHCRDLGEPFDFLTWFEFAPEHADAFDELVTTLRATEEWAFVEREVDVRLERER